MKNRILEFLLVLALIIVCLVVSVGAESQDVRSSFVCPCNDCVAIRSTKPTYTCPEATAWQSLSSSKTTFADGSHYYVGTNTTCGQLIIPAGTEAVLLIDNCTLRYQGTGRMISMNGTNDSTDVPITLHIAGNKQAGLQTKYTADSGTDGQLVQVGAYETTYLRLYGDLTLACEAGSTDASSGGLIKIPSKGRLYIHDSKNMGLSNDKDPVLMGYTATSTGNGGGAVYMQSGQLHMEAGTIQGGNATYGGAVYMGGGTFNMTGGTITDSTANYGGAIAVADGTLNLKSGTITGCSATKYGGGIYSKGGLVKIGMDLTNFPDGPVITDCSATTRGGGMYIVSAGVVDMGSGQFFSNDTGSSGNGGAVYIRGESDGNRGTFNMSGGTITGDSAGNGNSKGVRVQGGILNLSGTATIISAGVKDTMAGIDCLGGQITLDGQAHVYTEGSKNAYDIMIRDSGTPMLTVKSTWTGIAGVRILKVLDDNSYVPGGILGSYAAATGEYTGTLFLQGKSSLPRIYHNNGKLVFAEVQVCDENNSVWYKDNAAAVASVGSATEAYILLHSQQPLELTGKDIAVDFNGYDVTVSGTGTLYGFDSTASTTPGTAKVTATGVTVQTFVDNPVSGESFIATPQDGVYTFHKIKPVISGMTLRPDSASVYYSGTVFYDENLAQYIKDYGIAVQLWEMPDENFTETALYTRTQGAPASGKAFNGVLVRHIMKEAANNSARAGIPICADIYVTVEVDGQTRTYLSSSSGRAASMTLKELVSQINTTYSYLNDTQKTSINGMYTRFKQAMTDGTWKIGHIMAAVDPDAVKPSESVIQQRRDMAESYMREMANFMWRSDKDVFYTRDAKVLTDADLESYTGTVLKIRAGKLYRGIPYSYSGSSAWNFYDFASEPDSEGIHTISGIHWRNLNGTAATGSIMGNDCSSSIQQSWDYAGSSILAADTARMVEKYGYLRVGNYASSSSENVMTPNTCKENGIDVMSAAYSQLQKADAVVKRDASWGHTMMAVENHPVMTDGSTIDPDASYITVLHQTTGYMNKEAKVFEPAYGEDVYITYGIDDKYTYRELFDQGYLPVTCDIFVDPSPVDEFYLKDSESVFTFENILVGKFTSNRMLSAMTITITDENGKVVTEGTCYEHRQNLQAEFSFDLSWFTTRDAIQQRGKINLSELAPGKYHCTHVLRDAHGVSYTMRDFDFEVEGKSNHLILNKDGSYGGSLDEAAYGQGAPLNGAYDVENSAYYTLNNDYYNMPSTSQRIIYPAFSSYQQTMRDSDALACLLMVLNYMGEDVQNKYTELALLKMYEEVNGVTVYGNGVTEEGLIKLIESLDLGYSATNQDLAYSAGLTKDNTAQFFTDAIKDGKFVFVRYQSPMGFGWKVVIGYDTLGNVRNTQTGDELEHFGDDVIIFAEPNDGFDHLQDGYATERAQDFYVWWDTAQAWGQSTGDFNYVIVDPHLDITFERQPVDTTVKQTLFELHLPLNPDGSYGGTRDASLYGSIISGKGWWNHTDSNYYKINDYYNMGSEGTRVLLPNYTVLQQTMSSSCGNCAVGSILSYYGKGGDPYDMELEYVKHYETVNSCTIKGSGTNGKRHQTALREWGYETELQVASKIADLPFPTYGDYAQYMRTNLEAGRPIAVATNFGSSHYLTVIGFDNMGTDYIYDDVIIVADSCDYWDGYQDGYNVYPAYKFYTQHTNGSRSQLQSSLVIFK